MINTNGEYGTFLLKGSPQNDRKIEDSQPLYSTKRKRKIPKGHKSTQASIDHQKRVS